MLVRASLPTFLILGAISLTSTAQAFDRTCATAAAATTHDTSSGRTRRPIAAWPR